MPAASSGPQIGLVDRMGLPQGVVSSFSYVVGGGGSVLVCSLGSGPPTTFVIVWASRPLRGDCSFGSPPSSIVFITRTTMYEPERAGINQKMIFG